MEFIFLCDIIIPIMMIIVGRIMWKNPPKKINWMIGYRTTRSMKNMDTWKFAHEYIGKLWWKLGCIIILPSMLAHIPVYGGTESAIERVSIALIIIQIILVVGSMFPTEQALKETFTETGIRK